MYLKMDEPICSCDLTTTLTKLSFFIIIEIKKKQENENRQLQAIYFNNLKKENEHLSIVIKNLLEKLNKLEKESIIKLSSLETEVKLLAESRASM